MKKSIRIFLTLVFGGLTAFFAYSYIIHLQMRFNSEGNYFDPESMTVYHKHAVLAYGIITFLCFMITAIFFLLAIKAHRKV